MLNFKDLLDQVDQADPVENLVPAAQQAQQVQVVLQAQQVHEVSLDPAGRMEPRELLAIEENQAPLDQQALLDLGVNLALMEFKDLQVRQVQLDL